MSTTMERFASKVSFAKTQGGCWEWIASKNHKGYGRFDLDGKARQAHRVSWQLFNGRPVPDGLCICHTCDNRGCVNPDHLWLGTNAENNADMMRKGRNNQPKMEASGRSKLTRQDVLEIRALIESGEKTWREMAKSYGVGTSTIGHIKFRRQWRLI